MMNDSRTIGVINSILSGSMEPSDCPAVPMAVLTDMAREIERLRSRVKTLLAVMDAASPFLALPPEKMQDTTPFNQYTTAGDCRALNAAYNEAAKEIK